MGSGTKNKVARMLDRNSIGYEIDLELIDVVKDEIVSVDLVSSKTDAI